MTPPDQAPSATTVEPPAIELSADEWAGLIAASPPQISPRRGMLRKLLFAGLIAGVGVGASVMSCIGQSFSYRQARALEGIEQQIRELRTASCPSVPAPTAEAAP